MDRLPGPVSPYSHVELYRDAMGRGGQLPPGRTVSGVVVRTLNPGVQPLRYEVSILGALYIIESAAQYAPGTIIEFVGVPLEGGGVRLLLRGESDAAAAAAATKVRATPPQHAAPPQASPAGSTEREDTRNSAAEPRGGASDTAAIERAVAAALRRAQVSATPERIAAITKWIASDGLDPHAAARAAARLLEAGLPVSASLLRGGTLAESDPGAIDPHAALRNLARLLEGGSVPAEARAALARLVADAANSTAAHAAHGADSASTAAAPRIDTARLFARIEEIVGSVLREDQVLVRLQAEIARLSARSDSTPSLPPPAASAVEEHARALLDLAQPLAPDALLETMTPEARERALRLLAAIERDAIEHHPRLAPLREALRDLFLKLEGIAYAQLLEWTGLAEGARGWGAFGAWSGEAERLPFRVQVRKSPPGSAERALQFRLEVETGALGRVRVDGTLQAPAGDERAAGGRLKLEFAAEEAEIRGRIERGVPELLAALAEQGYLPGATIGALAPAARSTNAPERGASASRAPAAELDVEA
ncbi:MAG: flagellar hook-length control protein FliK [Planctomycetes bacterium]|nr:flagellar hook-length control protein FliK [Planctomycetota bacterium]